MTDPHTAGVYDTVYVDLDDDYSFADEKPVTQGVAGVLPRHERRRLHRPLRRPPVLHLGRQRRPDPGRPDELRRRSYAPAPGALLAWTGDFDPAIEGHGTLTASNVVGQGVVNGKAPSFADVPGGRPPGMVIGGAPKAKLAPMGDIYFSFDFSTQFGYFLTDQRQRRRRHLELLRQLGSRQRRLRRGQPGGRPLEHGLRRSHADGLLERQRRTRLRHVDAPAPVTGISVGASTQFGGDRLGFDHELQPGHGQRRDRLVGPRTGRDRDQRRRPRRRRRLLVR